MREEMKTSPRRPYVAPKVADAPPCGICDVEDQHPATLRYTWAWGEEGYCCDGHRSHLQTRADQLQRQISFVSLSPAPPVVETDTTAELRYAKAKLLEQEQQLHAQGEQLRDLLTRNQAHEQTIRKLNEQINRRET